jgi:hypothetical protein
MIAGVCACKQPVCEIESDHNVDTMWICIPALLVGFAWFLCMWVGEINNAEAIARLRASDVEKDATITRIKSYHDNLASSLARSRDRLQRLGVEAHGAAFVIQNLQTQLSGSHGAAARSEQRGNRAAVSSIDVVRRLTRVAREHEGTLRQRSSEEYGEYVRQALQRECVFVCLRTTKRLVRATRASISEPSIPAMMARRYATGAGTLYRLWTLRAPPTPGAGALARCTGGW